jgi:predicted RND superfamily exporter protein
MSQNTPVEWTARIGNWLVRWRWPLLILSLVIGVFAGFGGSKIAFKNDYRVFFSSENPQLNAFEELQRTYTKVDNIMFAVIPHEGTSFEAEVLTAVEELTAEAWKLR